MKKYITFILSIFIAIVFTSVAYAGFNDVLPSNPAYDAIMRLVELKIMGGNAAGDFRPDQEMSREEFAKTIISCNKLDSVADALIGISIYSDVEPTRWSCGYINAAINKGYINAKEDGKFHPEDPVTFAEVCAAFIKALGYDNNDLSGEWPDNCINKAKDLKITEGIDLNADDPVSRKAIAIMTDRLLITDVKSTSPAARQTFGNLAGHFTDCIVVGDSTSMDNLAYNQIATDKGIFYLKDEGIRLEIGNRYGFDIQEDTIVKVYNTIKRAEKLEVKKYKDRTVTYSTGSGDQETVLPENIVYYYKGNKIPYSNLNNILGINSVLVFTRNKNNTGFEYIVIVDPAEGSPGLYTECIVTGNSSTMETLADNQVFTDKGIFYLKDGLPKPEVGYKYGFAIEEDTIVYIYESLNTLERITVVKNIDKNVSYPTHFGEREMKLPEKTVYYYKGIATPYANLDKVLDVNSTIMFAWNKNKTGYEYAVILDPVYSAPEVAVNYNPDKMVIGSISLANCPIVRNGELIEARDIKEKDVVYNVWDVYRTNRYVMVVSNRVEGKLDGIMPNYISPKTIQVSGKIYDFSPYMKFSKITSVPSEFKTEDDVTILLGRDGKVVDIFRQEYAGQEVEVIITGNSKTNDRLLSNQVWTDKGVFYISDKLDLTLGNKYKVVINEDKIVKVEEELKTLTHLTVSDVVDNKITYDYPAVKTMVLPEKTEYYYNGVKVNYGSAKDVLQVNTSIIFAYNDEKTGYEYAVILDPVYSKPSVAIDYHAWLNRVGDISLKDVRIIKNGEIIKPEDIEELDVVYEVSDFFSTSKYVLVVDERVEGKIAGILPSKLSPKQLNLDGRIYDFSPDMKFEKIKGTTTSFKIDDEIVALLGYDGKVVDMLYESEEDTSDFAMVINYEKTISTDLDDYGSTLYYVKLLLTNGEVVKWKVDEDPISLKGSLVRFTKTDLDPDPDVEDIQVQLTRVNIYGKVQEYNIDKDERKIGDSFVTDNVTIFDRIHYTGSGDAQFDILNWDELPNGVVSAGKVQFINKAGEFEDVNLIVFDDLFDRKYRFGVVTGITPDRNYCTVDLIIDGVPHKFLSPELVSGEIGRVVKVEYVNNTVTKIVEWVVPAAEDIKVQAVDKKRVKTDDKIYQFKNNITIYFKDSSGIVTAKGIKDIDTAKFYGKVAVYLDKPLEQKGKVVALVIYE